MIKKEIRDLLRSPSELKLLKDSDDKALQTDDGELYPIIDGILCLLKEGERGNDLGDGKFYNNNPFGEGDWSNVTDVDAGVEKDLKKLLERYHKSALIIDVGSGAGRISNYLSLHGYENVVSLDYSLPSLKQVNINSNNICIWGNNLHLPIENNSFDLVISSGVIHHTPDPHKAFEECVRILKPGGRLYFRIYNIHSLYCYLYYTYGAILRLFDSTKYTRFMANLFGFKIYKLVRRLLFSSLSNRDDRILKAKFSNLFTKKMVYFFTTSEIENLIKKHGLVIEIGKKLGKTHRMHCYVSKKQA